MSRTLAEAEDQAAKSSAILQRASSRWAGWPAVAALILIGIVVMVGWGTGSKRQNSSVEESCSLISGCGGNYSLGNHSRSLVPTASPTLLPTPAPTSVSYAPGNLTVSQYGLLLSTGLSARLLARSGEPALPGQETLVHDLPDFGATYIDSRPFNPGGWIYVSNSEVRKPLGQGGVGAFTFRADGEVIDYRRILSNTTANCGGGSTPWGAWISCEETSQGHLYQVSPTGERAPAMITLGQDGGLFESFAYDVRDKTRPVFFVTEDAEDGALQRFGPVTPDWEDPWSILLGSGRIDYLVLDPSTGTFEWSANLDLASDNAMTHYPNAEGIDCQDGVLYFVSKKLMRLFILDLDAGTYQSESTRQGVFDGQPDQIQRVLGDDSNLLFFTEDGGRRPGIHGRNRQGQYFTILESDVYNEDESTGLSFSPDGRHLYFALQRSGLIYDVTRDDGLPFDAKTLNIKYHGTGE